MIRHFPRDSRCAQRAVPLRLASQRLSEVAARARQEQRAQRRARAAALEHVQRALRRLLGEELALKPEHIRDVVARELEHFRCAQRLELRLHPDDAARLGSDRAWCETLEQTDALTIIEDTSMTQGGCILASDTGEADARLETRLASAMTLLKDWSDGD